MTETDSQRDNLSHLVNLYRALDCPEIEDGGYLTANIELADTALLNLLKAAHTAYTEKFETCLLNGTEPSEDWAINQYDGPSINLVIKLPPRLFFTNLSDFIDKSTNLSMGNLRNDYFLVEENYLAGEPDVPHEIEQVEKICAWIKFLQEVLPHTETHPNWLTFVLLPESSNSNGRSKRTFRSKISRLDLNADLSRLSEFLEITKKNDLHASERKSVFRQVLAELLEQHPEEASTFSYILQNMNKLCQNYHDYYERYINSFSLEKLQKEVIEDYNQFSVQIRSALNEIISKTFAVPASLAAAALLVRVDNTASDIILTLVILFTTIITVLLLSWHSNNIQLIRTQIENKFEMFSNSGVSGTEFANKRQSELEASAERVKNRIYTLRILSWIPVILAGTYLWIKYPDVELLLGSFLFLY